MDTWVLWGFHPRYCDGVPIKITGGSPRECGAEMAVRMAQGFTCAIYRPGTAPAGLRAMACERGKS